MASNPSIEPNPKAKAAPAAGKSARVKAAAKPAHAPAAPDGEIVNVRRRQGRSVETRNKILQAATDEFASNGFEGATTRSIADRAKVRHGLVIYHFETKFGVWQAVMERAFSDFHTQFLATTERMTAEGAGPVEMLRTLNRNFIRLSVERPEVNWMLSHEAGKPSNRLTWLFDTVVGHDAVMSMDLIRKAQALGQFVPGDAAHLHFIFLGAVSRIFLRPSEVEQFFDVPLFSEAFMERHITLLESLFFRDPPEPAA